MVSWAYFKLDRGQCFGGGLGLGPSMARDQNKMALAMFQMEGRRTCRKDIILNLCCLFRGTKGLADLAGRNFRLGNSKFGGSQASMQLPVRNWAVPTGSDDPVNKASFVTKGDISTSPPKAGTVLRWGMVSKRPKKGKSCRGKPNTWISKNMRKNNIGTKQKLFTGEPASCFWRTIGELDRIGSVGENLLIQHLPNYQLGDTRAVTVVRWRGLRRHKDRSGMVPQSFHVIYVDPVDRWRRDKTTQKIPWGGFPGGERFGLPGMNEYSLRTLQPCRHSLAWSERSSWWCAVEKPWWCAHYTVAEFYTSDPIKTTRLGKALPERYDPTREMITIEHYYDNTCHHLLYIQNA